MDYSIVTDCDIIPNIDWQASADVDRAVFLDVGFLTDYDWRVLSADYDIRSCRDRLLHHR